MGVCCDSEVEAVINTNSHFYFKIMNFLEKDLEDIIFNAPVQELENRGLNVPHLKKRQVRIGNYGIADIIGVEKNLSSPPHLQSSYLRFSIFELKQKKITMITFLQAIRYARGLTSYLMKHKNLNTEDYKITICLIGQSVCMSDFIYLTDLLPNNWDSCFGLDLSIYTYSYDFDGISFNRVSGYDLKNKGF